jgi:hypothetical protein
MPKAPAPSTSHVFLRSIATRRGHASLLVLAGAAGALFGPGACGSDITNPASTGNATTGQPAGTGGMGGMSGGEGGEQSAGGMGGMGGTGGTGGGVGPGCKQDCENEPKNKVCDTMTGDCVSTRSAPPAARALSRARAPTRAAARLATISRTTSITAAAASANASRCLTPRSRVSADGRALV